MQICCKLKQIQVNIHTKTQRTKIRKSTTQKQPPSKKYQPKIAPYLTTLYLKKPLGKKHTQLYHIMSNLILQEVL